MPRASWLVLLLLSPGCSPPLPEAEEASPVALVREVEQASGSPCRYIDPQGEVVFGDELDIHEGFDFQEGLAGVKNHRGHLGYIDRQGRLVIRHRFRDGTSHREGFAGILQNGMCGYIDRRGELVVPRNYDSVTNFRDGWGLVRRNRRSTFVNAEAEEIGQLFHDAESFSEGFAGVAPQKAEDDGEGPLYGFIDTEGRLVIAPEFEDVEPFSEGLAAVRKEGRWGYVDASGTLVIEPAFDLAGPFEEGLAPAQVGSKLGYIDREGNWVVEPRFEVDLYQSDPDEKEVYVGRFVDGLAAVRQASEVHAEGGWGFIDRSGRWAVPPRFGNAHAFAEDRAAVWLDGKWGYIDRTGELVIPATFEKAQPFSEGLALVCDGS